MKLLTLTLKELIEMITILQFRCYFNFRMSLHKLMCTKLTTMTIFSIAVICFKGSEEEGSIVLCYINATIRSLQKVLIVRSLITYVLVRS